MSFSDSALGQRKTSGAILNAAGNEVGYEYVLECIGFGKTQWILLLIGGLMTLTSMSAQTSIGIIAIASQCEFEMNQMQKGIMMSACVAGIFLSTYFWGYLSDAFGRRTVLLYSALVTSLLQFISMFLTNVWLFNCINFVMGISLGGVSAATYAYLSEFNTAKHRAVVINYTSMFVSIAAIYVPGIAWFILSYDWSFRLGEAFTFRPWRLIILLTLLPGFIAALMLLAFPESPKLLLAQSKQEEAVRAVEWVCKFNTGKTIGSVIGNADYVLKPEFIDVGDILRSRKGCGVLISIWEATVPLFHMPHGKNFFISAVSVFGMFFSYSGMQIWYPEIVNRSTANEDASGQTVCEILDTSFTSQFQNSTMTNSTICDDSISTKTYVDNMIVGVAFLLGFTVQGALLNPLGRKTVMLGALAISTLSGIMLHFVANSIVVLILFCLYILMPGLAISTMCEAVVDLMPTHLRGKAVSICLTMGRLGVILGAYLIGVTLEPLCNTTFAIFTATMFVCGMLVQLLPI